MIVTGIIGVLAIGNITIIQQNAKMQVRGSMQAEGDQWVDALSEQLSNPTICSNFLGPNPGLGFGGGAALPPASPPGDPADEVIWDLPPNRSVENASQTAYFALTRDNTLGETPTLIGRNLEISRFSLGPYVENDAGDPTDDVVRLNVILSRVGVEDYNQDATNYIRGEIWLRIEIAGSEVSRCAFGNQP